MFTAKNVKRVYYVLIRLLLFLCLGLPLCATSLPPSDIYYCLSTQEIFAICLKVTMRMSDNIDTRWKHA